MRNPLYVLSVFIIAILTAHSLYAQLDQPVQDHIKSMMPNPVPASPNVASLGKFGDYQISHFSGLPEISIPIFEVQSGNLRVPITLRYHASGVKPTDVASWVGMGWSLSAGGQISRNVRGKRDEDHYYTNPLIPSPSVCGTYAYLRGIATGVTDADPDIFSYSYPGRSGKFLLSPNGASGISPLLIPAAPIRMNWINSSKQEITDENGILYRYGTGVHGSGSDFTNATNGGNPTLNATTAWYLMDMISPNTDDQILFDYQPVGTVSTHDISYTFTILDNCHASNGGTCPVSPSIPQKLNIDSRITQQGLEHIFFENGKIEFVLGDLRSDANELRLLDHINIYSKVSGSYVLLKSVKFIYSYFTNATGGNEALKLDEVQFRDKEALVVQRYKLSYFTNSFSWNKADDDFLNARDLWGYYNGALQNQDLILPQTVTSSPENVSFGRAYDRNVNPSYVKEGVLKRIDFPTGGHTIFDFESNKYLKDGIPTDAGGLRVTKITSSDGSASPPVIKTFKYGSAESGYGTPNFTSYQFNYSSSQLYFSDCPITAPIVTYQARHYYSNSAFNQDSYDASPVRYNYVTEYYGDYTGTINGKIIYEFDNGTSAGDVDHIVPTSNKYYRNSYFWKRGKLTRKTIYGNANNKLSETAILYNTYMESANAVGYGVAQFITGNNSTCSTGGTCTNESGDLVNSQTFFFTSYPQHSGAYLETGTSETTFENDDITKYVVKQSNKTYHTTKLQPLQIVTQRSNATEQAVTVNNYPFQLGANASSTGAAKGIYMLNEKNILATPIESYTYLQNSDETNQRIIAGQVTTYKQNPSNVNYVVVDQIYSWEDSLTMLKSNYVPVAVNGSNNGVTMNGKYKSRVTILNYDPYGNVQTISRANDSPVAYLYDYNNTLPVAEIRNAQNSRYTTTTIVQSTGSSAVTLGGQTNTITQAFSFTSDYTGAVLLKLSVPGNPSYSTTASYSGITSGSVTLAKNGCGLTVITLGPVSAGTHTITITVSAPGSSGGVGACGEIVFPKYGTVTNVFGTNESLYESFEESIGVDVIDNPAVAHTGNKYFSGDYTVYYTPPNTRSYVVDYWYRNASNKWVFISKDYSGTSMFLTEGSAIDNVRIYPKDAQITSYTYAPVVGTTSVTDHNGNVMYHEYDTFGRLKVIRDVDRNILKTYDYRYKMQ